MGIKNKGKRKRSEKEEIEGEKPVKRDTRFYRDLAVPMQLTVETANTGETNELLDFMDTVQVALSDLRQMEKDRRPMPRYPTAAYSLHTQKLQLLQTVSQSVEELKTMLYEDHRQHVYPLTGEKPRVHSISYTLCFYGKNMPTDVWAQLHN